MTFLEKAKLESKEKRIKFSEDGLPRGCPYKYGYEEDHSCSDVECIECWNREMPNTEPKEDASLKDYKDFTDDLLNQGYNKGLNDAWEFIFNKTGNMTSSEFSEIFDCVWARMGDEYTPQEALAKLKAYEEAQNKIEIGDVVKSTLYVDMNCGIVVNITDDKASLIHKDGKLSIMVPLEFLVKTGKHLELVSILEQIGE